MLIPSPQAGSQSLVATQETATAATAQVPPQCQQPHELHKSQSEEAQDRETEPAEQPTASTSKVDGFTLRRSATIGPIGHPPASMPGVNLYKTTTLHRRTTRTASSSSLDPRPSSTVRTLPPVMKLLLTWPQRSSPPLAFNFFNPTTDMRRMELPLPQPITSRVHTELGSGNSDRVTKPLRRSDSFSRRGSFLSLPSLNPFPSLPRFQPQLGAMGPLEPSPFARAPREHGRYFGTWVDNELCRTAFTR